MTTCHFSAEERSRIKESWKTLLEKKDGLEAGMLMFTKLFETNPDLKPYFKFDKDVQQLGLKLHIRAVIATLDRCIKNLHDWKNVDDNFKQLGMIHSTIGINKDQLPELCHSFIWMMEDVLEEYFTEDRKQACNAFIQLVADTMVKNM